MSNGEEKILRILLREGIKVQREKTFSDLRGGKFRYDFFLPDQHVIIEYNGEQHYYQVKKFHKTRSEFTKAQENDRRKISYALANNYTIYCIPYWELEKINTYKDLFSPMYIAADRWKNDKDWAKFNSN